MIIYVTRHGQPATNNQPIGTNHEFPAGNPCLTGLGLAQATCLGQYLKSISFKGKIFSSPYTRTLYTAQTVANQTQSSIYLEKAIQEYVTVEGKPNVDLLSLAKMNQLFPHLVSIDPVDDSWLFTGPESEVDVAARVSPFLQCLMNSGEEEVLLVGHGASVAASKKLLFEAVGMPYVGMHNWNCSLSKFVVNVDKPAVAMNCDVSFMPEDMVTSNRTPYRELSVS